MKHHLCLLLFLGAIHITLYGTPHFETISFGENIHQNYIFSMHQDEYGYMWFGTWAGLIRYDGYEYVLFKPYPNDPSSLSNNCVTSIIQDHNKNLWLGTNGGGLVIVSPEYLYSESFSDPNRSKEFLLHYSHQPEDPNSLSGNTITSLSQDDQGTIWIGTLKGGINRVHASDSIARLKFSTYLLDNNPENKYQQPSINCLLTDSDSSAYHVWVGTNRSGLYRLSIQPGDQETKVLHFHNNNSDLSSSDISSLHSDHYNTLWIGTRGNGLYATSLNKQEVENEYSFHLFQAKPGSESSLSNNTIEDILTDHSGHLWVATAKGLNKSRHAVAETRNHNSRMDFVTIQQNNENKLSDNYILSLYLDHSNILWLSTYQGLNQLNLHAKPFRLQQGGDLLVDNHINSLASQSENSYWTGSERGVLSHIMPGGSTHYIIESGAIRKLSDTKARQIRQAQNEAAPIVGLIDDTPTSQYDFINVLSFDASGNLWIGGVGLYVFDPMQGKQQYFGSNPYDNTTIHGWAVWDIYIESAERIWMGTTSGLELYEPEKKRFTLVSPDDSPSSERKKAVYTIIQDRLGNIWAGVENGLLFLSKENIDNGSFTYTLFQHNKQDKSSISTNKIRTLLEGETGEIWIGTEGSGLNQLLINDTGSVFQQYDIEDGLPDNSIQSLQEDQAGNLWISTAEGLCKRDKQNGLFTTYTQSEGVQSLSFQSNAHLRWNGLILFGTQTGIVHFRPEAIQKNPASPRVGFTKFSIANEMIYPNEPYQGRIILDHPLIATERLTLHYDNQVLTFHFNGFHYENPDQIQYAYRLVNFDHDWIYTSSNQRVAHYNNIPPGRYTLQVKAANHDKVWSPIHSITLLVKPPFWLTWWAYGIYLVSFLLILLLIRFITLRRERLRSSILMLEKEKKQQAQMSQKDKEINQSKIRFFTNISHEFRTPLTLIKGPVDTLKTQMNKKNKLYENVVLIERNAKLLSRLANQILDFQKLEFQKLTPKPQPISLYPFVHSIYASFSYLASERNLQYTLTSTEKDIIVWIDPDMIDKVLYNLLSNAFKFTPSQGSIEIEILNLPEKQSKQEKTDQYPEGHVEIIVKDSGKGISDRDIIHIFDRYYQAEHSGSSHREGSGIGLALAKEYIELHQGSIQASHQDERTIFSISLPKGKLHFRSEQLIHQEYQTETKEEEEEDELTTLLDNISSRSNPQPPPSDKQNEKQLILIVEDNHDVRSYIKLSLENRYEVRLAENGASGLRIAQEIIPDLIISDIMMPDMDGYTMCKSIRNNEKTSHIPLIMLTALASESDKMKGLEIGADDYLIKPFNTSELIMRISNMLQRRQQIREHFNKNMIEIEGVNPIHHKDQEFIHKALKLIEKHMDDPRFNVEDFSQDLGLSRAQLYRKIKGLTGKSVNEFVRLVRLKKATQLMVDKNLNISETMYRVGFNSSSYFTKCFKDVYQMSPSEYIQKHKNQ